jgi:hypothetical protein
LESSGLSRGWLFAKLDSRIRCLIRVDPYVIRRALVVWHALVANTLAFVLMALLRCGLTMSVRALNIAEGL